MHIHTKDRFGNSFDSERVLAAPLLLDKRIKYKAMSAETPYVFQETSQE